MKKEKDSAVNNGRLVGNKRMNNAENRDLTRETVLDVQRERERERELCMKCDFYRGGSKTAKVRGNS